MFNSHLTRVPPDNRREYLLIEKQLTDSMLAQFYNSKGLKKALLRWRILFFRWVIMTEFIKSI